MRREANPTAFLSPDAFGWRVSVAGSAERTAPTLGEAAAGLPANSRLEIALPCQAVVLERHKFPSIDRSELEGMIQLQLEKTLPFPVDEVSDGFEVLSQDENESTVLTVAAPYAQLGQLCAPLRESGRTPERISLFAFRVAAGCPAEETVLALWPEQGQTIVAIVAGAKLAWAQPIPATDADAVLAELPSLLLAAELEGAPTDFTAVRVAEGLTGLADPLAIQFGRVVQPLDTTGGAPSAIDLLPASWRAEARRHERGEKVRQNLLIAAVVYLVLVAAAFIHLAWLKRQAQNAQAEHDALKPRFADIERQMARWEAFAPAVDPKRSIVEVLHQLTKTWQQNEKLQFTSLTFGQREWVLRGEGTTDTRFDFVQRLKRDTELEGFDLQFPPEQPLKDDRVAFTITGRPR